VRKKQSRVVLGQMLCTRVGTLDSQACSRSRLCRFAAWQHHSVEYEFDCFEAKKDLVTRRDPVYCIDLIVRQRDAALVVPLYRLNAVRDLSFKNN
jgi:hypothetical protein